MNNIKIGKFVLENLTSGMYEDSKIIYREYIQNSADQIDKANKYDLFKGEKLFIDVKISESKRNVTIKDNATGIKKNEIHETLAHIADSNKERGVDKGFRGIGRLGGLAYCKTLKFITSYKGESEKTIMTWDAEKIKMLINDKNSKISVQEIMQEVITYEYVEEESDAHYFTVEMLGITEENSSLLDIDEVRKYIEWNCPVPIENKFLFLKKIKEYSESLGLLTDEYDIYLNNDDIRKPYTTRFKDTNGKTYDEMRDVAFETFQDENGDLIAWSWIGITSYEKNIPQKYNDSKGIRLRKENIQIGDSNTLNKFFSEARGNGYFVGEVHVVHKDLIPNARRDYFNETKTLVCFEQLFEKYANELKKVYYMANEYKNAVKKINAYENLKNEIPKFVDKKEKEEYDKKLEKSKKSAEDSKKKMNKIHVKKDETNLTEKVVTSFENTYKKEIKTDDEITEDKTSKVFKEKKYDNRRMFLTSELDKLGKSERKVVEKIYKIIKENLPADQSNELIDKIQGEFK